MEPILLQLAREALSAPSVIERGTKTNLVVGFSVPTWELCQLTLLSRLTNACMRCTRL